MIHLTEESMKRYHCVISMLIVGSMIFAMACVAYHTEQSFRVAEKVDDLRGICRTDLDWLWNKLDVTPGRPRFGRIVEIDLMNMTGGRPYLQDEDLTFLEEVPSLERLNLALCDDITDGAIQHLRGLDNLRELDLRGTQVTTAGVTELKRALPHCKILHTADEKKAEAVVKAHELE